MPKPTVQIKFTIEANTVSAFKARCALEGISMTSVISQFMKTAQPIKDIKVKTDTRPQRKKAVSEYIGLLENIMYNEERYRDAIPEQFESRFETADNTCEKLAEAISSLEDAY